MTSLLVAGPLLLLYEVGILLANPGIRNGADASFRRLFLLFGAHGEWIWLGLLLFGLAVAGFLAWREEIPAHRCAFPMVAEGFLYSLIFGPVVLLLRGPLGAQGLMLREHLAAGPPGESPVLHLLLSVGAGVYEEALFRLLLLSLLYFLGKKLCDFLAIPAFVAAIFAVLVSSLAFSGFHHLGAFAAPFSWGAFFFRTFAGALLGAIFILRGFGVAVYTHAFYDVLFLFSPWRL